MIKNKIKSTLKWLNIFDDHFYNSIFFTVLGHLTLITGMTLLFKEGKVKLGLFITIISWLGYKMSSEQLKIEKKKSLEE
jgi:hypothetical protein